MPVLTPQQFVAKWRPVTLPERSVAQQHYLDLCALFRQKTPAEADPTGEWYTFERSAKIVGGGQGWADVWWDDHFGWEYKTKGKYKTLSAAYQQLLRYREDLKNPPLLVVSDISRTEIHTNFPGTAKQTYSIALEEMTAPEKLRLLRKVFTDPYSLRPGRTPKVITEEVAGRFASLAEGIRRRGNGRNGSWMGP
jgi:hypothetical protein